MALNTISCNSRYSSRQYRARCQYILIYNYIGCYIGYNLGYYSVERRHRRSVLHRSAERWCLDQYVRLSGWLGIPSVSGIVESVLIGAGLFNHFQWTHIFMLVPIE